MVEREGRVAALWVGVARAAVAWAGVRVEVGMGMVMEAEGKAAAGWVAWKVAVVAKGGEARAEGGTGEAP